MSTHHVYPHTLTTRDLHAIAEALRDMDEHMRLSVALPMDAHEPSPASSFISDTRLRELIHKFTELAEVSAAADTAKSFVSTTLELRVQVTS